MAKKKGEKKTVKDVYTFPIHKNQTIRANLNDYIKLLRSKHSHLPTKEYLTLVHNYIARYTKMKKGVNQSMIVQTTNKIRICHECNKWAVGSQKMIQCSVCEDSFHSVCAGEQSNSHDEYSCKNC